MGVAPHSVLTSAHCLPPDLREKIARIGPHEWTKDGSDVPVLLHDATGKPGGSAKIKLAYRVTAGEDPAVLVYHQCAVPAC